MTYVFPGPFSVPVGQICYTARVVALFYKSGYYFLLSSFSFILFIIFRTVYLVRFLERSIGCNEPTRSKSDILNLRKDDCIYLWQTCFCRRSSSYWFSYTDLQYWSTSSSWCCHSRDSSAVHFRHTHMPYLIYMRQIRRGLQFVWGYSGCVLSISLIVYAFFRAYLYTHTVDKLKG